MREHLRHILSYFNWWVVFISFLGILGLAFVAIQTIREDLKALFNRKIALSNDVKEIVSVGYIRNGYLSAGLISRSDISGDSIILTKYNDKGDLQWEHNLSLGGES